MDSESFSRASDLEAVGGASQIISMRRNVPVRLFRRPLVTEAPLTSKSTEFPDQADARSVTPRLREKVGFKMKIDRYGLGHDQSEDVTKYHFAKGSQLLRGLADHVSEIYHRGRHINEHELRSMHADLKHLWDIVRAETIAGIPPDQEGTASGGAAKYHQFYSDGTQVVHILHPSGDVDVVPPHFREPFISPDPCPGTDPPEDGRGRRRDVRVELPPHERPTSPTKRGTRARPRNPKTPSTVVAPTLADVSGLRARLEGHR